MQQERFYWTYTSFSEADLYAYLIIYISGIDLYMYKHTYERYTIFMDGKKEKQTKQEKIVTIRTLRVKK